MNFPTDNESVPGLPQAAPSAIPAISDSPFLSSFVSIDLEVSPKDDRIRKFGAVSSSSKEGISGGGTANDLARLDRFAEGASFILGHNIIKFDIPHLRAAMPDMQLLRLPVVDTLRLSPLAFPSNPYHRLVKHYQDGGILRGSINDPELDSRICLQLFEEQFEALHKMQVNNPDLLAAWHRLTTPNPAFADRALNGFFSIIRNSPRPSETEARLAISRLLEDAACVTNGQETVEQADIGGWALTFALAWLSVAGGNSVMPPWVRHQFPEAGRLVQGLRDTSCSNPSCRWCRERHDPRRELKRWFGFDDYRPEPADEGGRSLQHAIAASAMERNHVLGILPTGTGKSICYQVPALSRYDKTGALTVVISPLVALMADQVSGLETKGIGSCVTINGLLSMPERSHALDRVRLGDASMVLVSPEQLRSTSFRRVLDQRQIGSWVLDEAHCLSRWGHDFRPDYRYVGRFIREKAANEPVPPVLCLTATAKPDVIDDIARYFRDELEIELSVFDGGAERSNLTFEVVPTSGGEKFGHIHQVLDTYLPETISGGAIIYCATRRQSEEVAEFLQLHSLEADHFHAGLQPESKKDVQKRFIGGELRAIAATNAFGMGIDKPDVRLVVHADIPGSLENYFQEAGRAGRDREKAHCVLLYAPEDVERQFGMSASSRINAWQINGVLKALRNLDRRKRFNGKVVATTGEILTADDENAFEQDSTTDDTRMRTAVAWLEEAALISREENLVQIFPSSLRVNSVEEARNQLTGKDLQPDYRRRLLRITETLIHASADEGVSTDELMGISGLSAEGVRRALYDLERLGIASNDTVLTAFVHAGVERSSRKRLEQATQLETSLIDHMRELEPDMDKNGKSMLHLRHAAQFLRDEGLSDPLPEKLWRIIRSISFDGRGEDGAGGSISVRRVDAEAVSVTLRRSWNDLALAARLRREAAGHLLEHLLGCLPEKSRGVDLLAETTFGKLVEAIESDMILKSRIKRTDKLMDRALPWLHEQDVIRLNKGLTVFRPAMTIHLRHRERRGFTKADFTPLELHYKGQTLQVHVMAEYAERGLSSMRDALRLSRDYFSNREGAFLEEWLPGRDKEIGRQTTPASWQAIVDSLNDPVQKRIVADDREQTNVLVLAGPGSGKTRVIVHRIAYLVRVRRENPRSILALAYNRHAAVEIRRRLRDLIENDARGVTVLTCHALAMRLGGSSFVRQSERPDDSIFQEMMHRAIELLNGKGLLPEEADEQRERLLAGFRWILVDEYQDIGPDEYELISALAGRTLNEDTGKLSLFAVGDDDQNIYAFKGSSVEFIRRFEEDYGPKPIYLLGNYRSTHHIISAANSVIEPAADRMKSGQPITIDRARLKSAPGGSWEERDPVSHGKVQILHEGSDMVQQAQIAVDELQRLASLDPNWEWSRCAVVARQWKFLEPVRACCEINDIPSQMGNEEIPSFWHLRDTREFVNWLHDRDPAVVDGTALAEWAAGRPDDNWNQLLRQAVEEHAQETGGGSTPVSSVIEWLAEWGREIRRRPRGLMLLTAHGAKGLEFDHVVVLAGGWKNASDEERRLYYVAMTRARQTLSLARLGRSHPFLAPLADHLSTTHRARTDPPHPAPEQLLRLIRTRLSDVDLGFSGRWNEDHRIHRDIAALSPGDELELSPTEHGRLLLRNAEGRTVGRMAKSFCAPDGMRCRSVNVYAVTTRRRVETSPEYLSGVKCDEWEVVLPEFVFEPLAGNPS